MNLAELEKPLVERARMHAEGNKSKAAEVLGIHRRFLYEKMRPFKIDEESPYGVAVGQVSVKSPVPTGISLL